MQQGLFYSILPLLLGIFWYLRIQKSISKETPFLVFIVNSSLKMTKGKIISQIAHAMTDVIAVLLKDPTKYSYFLKNKKVLFYKGSQNEINELSCKAHNNQIRYSKIFDAGRTQIPSGSHTVLVIGPTTESQCSDWFKNLVQL